VTQAKSVSSSLEDGRGIMCFGGNHFLGRHLATLAVSDAAQHRWLNTAIYLIDVTRYAGPQRVPGEQHAVRDRRPQQGL